MVDDGAIATADREELIGTWMEDRDIAVAWQMAPVFAAAGVDRAWLDALRGGSATTRSSPALRWISSTIGMTSLLAELTDATIRIANLVADVKSYSQVDRARAAAHRHPRWDREHARDARAEARAASR